MIQLAEIPFDSSVEGSRSGAYILPTGHLVRRNGIAHVGTKDLRGENKAGTDNQADGFCLVDSDTRPGRGLTLGHPDDKPSEKSKRLIESALGISGTLQANSVADIVREIYLRGDPTGATRVKPMRVTPGDPKRRIGPRKPIDVRVGRYPLFRIKQSKDSPEFARALECFRQDAKRIYEQQGNSPTLEKYFGQARDRYGLTAEQLKWRSDVTVTPRTPETTVTHDFAGTSSALGGSFVEGASAITGYDNDMRTVSGEARLDSGTIGVFQLARWNSDLSADDMQVLMEVDGWNRASFTMLGNCARMPSTTTPDTYYFGAVFENATGEQYRLSKFVAGSQTVVDALLTNIDASAAINTSSAPITLTAIDSEVSVTHDGYGIAWTDTAVTGQVQAGIIGYRSTGSDYWYGDNFSATDDVDDSSGGGSAALNRAPKLVVI